MMRSRIPDIFFRTIITLALFAVVACSTPSAQIPITNAPALFSPADMLIIDWIRNELPGSYTNYTQVVESGYSEESSTDLTVRELTVNELPVFLFESHQRNSAQTNYDLYWTAHNPQSNRLELQFSRISGSELSLNEAESLHIGFERAIPGCAIDLQLSDAQLTGQTMPDSCAFENPVNGRTRVYRSINLSPDQLQLVTLELAPGEVVAGDPPVFYFQKQQIFKGEVSINISTSTDGDEPVQWLTSTQFIVIDDGRVSRLYDADMNNMDYAIKLSRLHWRDNEPAYLKLEVIRADSGEAQAYSWFNPGSDQIVFEQDWVKVNLQKTSLQDAQ